MPSGPSTSQAIPRLQKFDSTALASSPIRSAVAPGGTDKTREGGCELQTRMGAARRIASDSRSHRDGVVPHAGDRRARRGLEALCSHPRNRDSLDLGP